MTRYNQNQQRASLRPLITAVFLAALAAVLYAAIQYAQALGLDYPQAVSGGHSAFVVLVTLCAAFFLRWLIADAPFNLLRRYTFAPLLRTFVTLLLLFGSILFLLHRLLGLNILPLFTTSAVLTGIIALSMQDTFKNLFTGLWINMERVVAKGDWVRFGDKEGMVMDVTWRTTRLLTRENAFVFIPNRLLAEGVLENYTYPSPLNVVEIKVSASYKDPPNKVKDVLLGVASHVKGVAEEPAPVVWITGYGEFCIHYDLRVWINDFKRAPDVNSDLSSAIWYAFRRSNIEMPYPARTVYYRKAEAQPGTDICGVLKSIDFLGALDEGAIAAVADYSRLEVFGQGEAIVREGEDGRSCYYIISGSVEILHKGGGHRETRLTVLVAGDLFGEMSLLTGEKRNATALAKEDTTCLVMESDAFKKIFDENPDVAASLSELLARRRHEQDDLKTMGAQGPGARDELKNSILAGIRRFFKI
ncbi:MAG: mechanosensitive ion channel [Deltaproteobacteria bacterium]|nr:mechanosensitive ion channel [Deltaproteobacteria bacterium]